MLLGCMAMAMHYEHGVQSKKRIPLTMALGHPNTSKSTAIECALSVIGRANIPLGGNEIHIDVITFKNPIFIYEQDIVSVHRYAVEGTK